jgi:hypothetical protein
VQGERNTKQKTKFLLELPNRSLPSPQSGKGTIKREKSQNLKSILFLKPQTSNLKP